MASSTSTPGSVAAKVAASPSALIGATVEMHGYVGVVRFAGVTDFASGTWVGIELGEAVGKNDGSVQGRQYFTCPAKHGIFVRASQVKKVIAWPGEGSLSDTHAAITQNDPSAATQDTTPTRTPTQTAATRSRPSTGRITPPRSTVASTASPSRPSSSRGAGNRPGPGSPQKPTAKTAAGSRATTPSRLPRPGSVTPASINTSVKTTKAIASSTPTSAGHKSSVPKSTEKASRVDPDVTTPARQIPPATVTRTPGMQLVSTKEYEELKLKLHLADKRITDYQGKLRKLDALTQELGTLEQQGSKVQAKLTALQKEHKIVQATLAEREESLELLQVRLEKHEKDQGARNREAAAATTNTADETTIRKLEERIQEMEEDMEMMTLDKELAEERAETLQRECDGLKERLEEVTLDLEIAREEAGADVDMGPDANPADEGLAKASTEIEARNAHTAAETQPNGVTAEKHEDHYRQLQQQRDRLQEALLRLKTVSQTDAQAQQETIDDLTEKVNVLEPMHEKYPQLAEEHARLQEQCEDLRELLSDAQGAEALVEEMSEKMLEMEDKIRDMQAVVEDLTAMKELNDELESAHIETERAMQEDLDRCAREIQQMEEKIREGDVALADRDKTVIQFRELVKELQSDILELRHDQGEDPDVAAQAAAKRREKREEQLSQLPILQASYRRASYDRDVARVDAVRWRLASDILQAYVPEQYFTLAVPGSTTTGSYARGTMLMTMLQSMIGQCHVLLRHLPIGVSGVDGSPVDVFMQIVGAKVETIAADFPSQQEGSIISMDANVATHDHVMPCIVRRWIIYYLHLLQRYHHYLADGWCPMEVFERDILNITVHDTTTTSQIVEDVRQTFERLEEVRRGTLEPLLRQKANDEHTGQQAMSTLLGAIQRSASQYERLSLQHLDASEGYGSIDGHQVFDLMVTDVVYFCDVLLAYTETAFASLPVTSEGSAYETLLQCMTAMETALGQVRRHLMMLKKFMDEMVTCSKARCLVDVSSGQEMLRSILNMLFPLLRFLTSMIEHAGGDTLSDAYVAFMPYMYQTTKQRAEGSFGDMTRLPLDHLQPLFASLTQESETLDAPTDPVTDKAYDPKVQDALSAILDVLYGSDVATYTTPLAKLQHIQEVMSQRLGAYLSDLETNPSHLRSIPDPPTTQPPWIASGKQLNLEASLHVDLQRKFKSVNEEMYHLVKKVKVKEQAIEERDLKVSLLEERLSKAREQLDQMSHMELQVSKSTEQLQVYEEAMDTLRHDYEQLERDHAAVKKQQKRQQQQATPVRSRSGGTATAEDEDVGRAEGHGVSDTEDMRSGAVPFHRGALRHDDLMHVMAPIRQTMRHLQAKNRRLARRLHHATTHAAHAAGSDPRWPDAVALATPWRPVRGQEARDDRRPLHVATASLLKEVRQFAATTRVVDLRRAGTTPAKTRGWASYKRQPFTAYYHAYATVVRAMQARANALAARAARVPFDGAGDPPADVARGGRTVRLGALTVPTTCGASGAASLVLTRTLWQQLHHQLVFE